MVFVITLKKDSGKIIARLMCQQRGSLLFEILSQIIRTIMNFHQRFSAKTRFLLAGIAFGTCFPIIAGGIRTAQYGFSALSTQIVNDPLLWIIFTAPIFLGGAAFIAGTLQHKAEMANILLAEEKSSVQRKVDESVAIIAAQQEEAHQKDVAALQAIQEDKNYLEERVYTLLEAMQEVAQGNLMVSVQPLREDRIGELYKGFNAALASMSALVRQISNAVEETVNATAAISQESRQVAAGTRAQTEQVGNIAAAVEETVVTIGESNRQLAVASDEAESARKVAVHGNAVIHDITTSSIDAISRVVEQASETIKDLGTSSEAISEIAKVIDEIADQTNLLALNAAIEAARAGDQGRGFAVVADEVRKLAERTQQATKEISSTVRQVQHRTQDAVREITSGVREVQKGQDAVQRLDVFLRKVIERSERVSDILTHLATASEQHSKATEEIAEHVHSIVETTQQAALAVQETSYSIKSLEKLAEHLQDVSEQFQVAEL
jgi:methyl-accepting chemotaxis protein